MRLQLLLVCYGAFITSCTAVELGSANGKGEESAQTEVAEPLEPTESKDGQSPRETSRTARVEGDREFNVGGQTSGGGAAIVCRTNGQSISSVELLDLYEGATIHGHDYPTYTGDANEIVEQVLEGLAFNRFILSDARDFLSKTLRDWRELPDGTVLNVPEDVGDGPIVVREGCKLEGIGYYQEDELTVAGEYYRAMNETHKAAFILHETIYQMARYFRESSSTSRTAREMVAALFAQDQAAVREKSNAISWNQDHSFPVVHTLLTRTEDDIMKLQVSSPSAEYANISLSCKVTRNGGATPNSITIDTATNIELSLENVSACHYLTISVSGCRPVTEDDWPRDSESDNSTSLEATLSYGDQQISLGERQGHCNPYSRHLGLYFE